MGPSRSRDILVRVGESKLIFGTQLHLNRGVAMRSFGYPAVRPRLEALGFKLNTMYSCLVNYLIRPKAAAIALIAQYTSFFALPQNFVIGVQIRTGDKAMVRAQAVSRDASTHSSVLIT